jgi:hypothetical protein
MSRQKKVLSEKEIDELVADQADDETAWDNPVRIRQTKVATPNLIAKSPRRVESQRIKPASQKE